MKFSEPDPERLIPALKVLGEPNRLRILCSLGLECRPVSEIINQTGLSQTNVSFHLRVLREAEMVRAERRGPFVYYCLTDPDLLRILEDLKRWLDARLPLPTTTASQRVRRGKIILPTTKSKEMA